MSLFSLWTCALFRLKIVLHAFKRTRVSVLSDAELPDQRWTPTPSCHGRFMANKRAMLIPGDSRHFNARFGI